MNNPGLADHISDSEKTLQDYLDVILRRIWIVAIIFVLILVITTIYAFTVTPLYTSTASVELEEKSSKFKDKDSVYGTPEYDQFKGYLSTQIEILKSRSMAESLVTRMNLLESPEFASKGWNLLGALGAVFSWITRSDDSDDHAWQKTAKQNAVVSNVMRRVNVKPVKQSNLLQVSMDATNRRLAEELLQNYIDLYLERNLEKRRTESLQAATWLKEELVTVEKKLRDAQVALLDFAMSHAIVDSRDGGFAQVMGILNKKMEGAIKAQEARAKVQALEEQGSSEEAGVLMPKDISNEYIGKLKQELAMMESEYTQMRGLYSPSYPKLKMLKKKIQFLTDRIETMEKNLVSTALSSAKQEERLLEGSYDSAKREAGRIRSLEAEYSALRKDVDTHTEFQVILLKEFKQMDIRARTISNDIKLVDRPSLPNNPSWPKKKLFLLVGSLIGLVLGVAAAFVADQIDNTLQSPREIDTGLGAKRLGVVPDATKLLGSGQQDASAGTAYEFLAYEFPRSPMSDAIRNIQTSIFLANPEHPTKCLAVSSATPSEGKSLIAVSIATVLASDKTKRVVIVDADLRKPRLHRVFGRTEPGRGFTSIFNGKEPEYSRLLHAYAPVPGLFYLTSGPVPDDPVAILQSDRAKHVFAELRHSFDHVVVDCPPILGFADTSLISLNVDGLVMVARQGHVGRDELREAMQIISSTNGCPILGVVMNGAYAPGASRYGYRYHGHYYYSNRYNKYYSRTGA